jgi:hypothetical protein
MHVCEFEQKVWEIDRLRVIIRAGHSEVIEDFDWVNAAEQNHTLVAYANLRIIPKVGERQYLFINGRGSEPNGEVLVRDLRASYLRTSHSG